MIKVILFIAGLAILCFMVGAVKIVHDYNVNECLQANVNAPEQMALEYCAIT